ncbi:MAG: hypothetical protein KC561_08435 [Myxococcales bacterium]|nr:hypothetical protein [Myxococcales bacterium]
MSGTVCPACHYERSEPGSSCPRCGQNYSELPPEATPSSASADPAPRGASTRSGKSISIPFNLVAGLALVGLAVVLFSSREKGSERAETAPVFELEPALANADGEDPCLGTERCVTVYVAPWCPACRRSRPTVRQVQEVCENDPTTGFRVVVGQDRPGPVEQMATAYGSGTFVDPSGQYYRQLGGDGVPFWFVSDAQGQILTAFAGTYTPARAHLEMLGL